MSSNSNPTDESYTGPCHHPQCPRGALYKRLRENPVVEGMINPFSPCGAEYCPMKHHDPHRNGDAGA